MKFAKELQQDLVPEWRVKYLDYKAGKKHVKAVARAFNRAPPTPYTSTSNPTSTPAAARTDAPRSASSPFDFALVRRWSRTHHPEQPEEASSLRGTSAPMAVRPRTANAAAHPAGRPIPPRAQTERDGLADAAGDMHYGSFGLTPPLSVTPPPPPPRAYDFALPAPAIKVPSNTSELAPKDAALQRRSTDAPRGHGIGDGKFAGRSLDPSAPDAGAGAGSTPSPRRRLQRMLTAALPHRNPRTPEIGMQELAMDLYRQREREFFRFLQSELDKVESFYKLKEDEAGERLLLLKEQLRVMGSRRRQELSDEGRRGKHEANGHGHGHGPAGAGARGHPGNGEHKKLLDQGYLDQVRAKFFRPSPNSRALSAMAQTPVVGPRPGADAARDYIRRPEDDSVSYRTAKRKLKLALQEFYRGLELLKSFALLNRTAFRKLNKKYDKAVNARPAYRFMNEKVSRAWFVNSDVLEGHIRAVEDLYADFFERGNHKVAVGKLKSLTRRPGDESASAFRSGLLVGTGAVFGVQGLAFGIQLLSSDDAVLRQETSYLLQIYGGYFLMLFIFSLFVIDCYVWTENKINYPFIFEFDTRHQLDWRQLAEFPSFFLLLLGVFVWLNFSRYGSEDMFLYYPVVLIGLSVLIILLPARVLAPASRRWFAYAHWRLLLAGFYPVEFRDFFLGDIYCSLTYAVCNISLFFCLYANEWENPVRCNSSNSRLMGFFAALPPIWRLLQCLRRYKDTRNIFPHLVNGGKYCMSIMAAVTLSLYRMSGTRGNLGLFVAFATINGVYTSIWDLFMDFSLLQPSARHRFLRDITAIKKRWVYYVIMVADPILRFAWIFYPIFTHDRQHSTVASFLIGFAEVFRRGMWALLRVENEHCANVAVYKASRDVPLPYRLQPLVENISEEEEGGTRPGSGEDGVEGRGSGEEAAAPGDAAATATSVQRVGTRMTLDEEAGVGAGAGSPPPASGTVRRRRTGVVGSFKGLQRSFSKILAEAHRQDFVKRRKPEEAASSRPEGSSGPRQQSDDDDEDDDDDDEEDDEVIEEAEQGPRREAVEEASRPPRTVGGSSRG